MTVQERRTYDWRISSNVFHVIIDRSIDESKPVLGTCAWNGVLRAVHGTFVIQPHQLASQLPLLILLFIQFVHEDE